eukprot:254261_1
MDTNINGNIFIDSVDKINVLIIGLKGIGFETAKNVLLMDPGPKKLILYDHQIVNVEDLGTNCFLNEDHIGNCCRSKACLKELQSLNYMVDVSTYSGDLSDAFLKSFHCIIITKHMSQKELFRINNSWRERSDFHGQPGAFIVAVTNGLCGHIFTDFGDAHTVTDANGEPLKRYFIEEFDKSGIVTLFTNVHNFEDGDSVSIDDIVGEKVDLADQNTINIEILNTVKDIHVRHVWHTWQHDGEERIKRVTNKVRLDLAGTKLENKEFSEYQNGGIMTEIKKKMTLKFKPLSECLVPDSTDTNENMLHLLFVASLAFEEKNGYFPRLHSRIDAKEFSTILRSINGNGSFVEYVDVFEHKINSYCWYFASELSPLCSILGGIVAHEIHKIFGRFTPIHQWFHFEYDALIPATIPCDAIPQHSRYDHQVAVFGESFQQQLHSQNAFVIGSGDLGCEYLKGLAMMGVSCGKSNTRGKVWCVDMNRIELRRAITQKLLFRDHHVGVCKSTAAKHAIRSIINPHINMQAVEMKIDAELDNTCTLTDSFWNKLDSCWIATRDKETRGYVDYKCMLHWKPSLLATTIGTKCCSEVIVPFITNSYTYSHSEDDHDETDGIPLAGKRGRYLPFPLLPKHCVYRAKATFDGIMQMATAYNYFMEDHLDDLCMEDQQYEYYQFIERCLNIHTRSDAYDYCIRQSVILFVNEHVTKIKKIMHLYPPDEMVKSYGARFPQIQKRFWSGTKRFPQTISLNMQNEEVFAYIYTVSNLYADMCGIRKITNKQQFKCHFAGIKSLMPLADESIVYNHGVFALEEYWENIITGIKNKLSRIDKSHLVIKKMNSVELDIDDWNNTHLDFITCAAKMYAQNWKIKDEITASSCANILGNYIETFATTNAVVAGLLQLEFYKLVFNQCIHEQKRMFIIFYMNDHKTVPLDIVETIYAFCGYHHECISNILRQSEYTLRNSDVNLATMQLHLSESERVKQHAEHMEFDPVMYCDRKYIPYPPGWTCWDLLIFDEGDLTVHEFVDLFPKKYDGIIVELLMKHGKMEKGHLLYNSFLKRNKMDKEKLIDKYCRLYDAVPYEVNYVILAGSFCRNLNTDEEIEMELPPIKYIFK